jgi:excinuclease UvrABC nuclease subunit
MKEILIENLEIGGVKLPESPGVIAFFGGGKMLMCGMSSNISDYLGVYFQDDIEEKNRGELLELCDKVGYWETGKVFAALLGMKALLQKYAPPFNRLIRHYDDYVYLGLNFVKVPFIKVESTTIHDYFYMGPFRSRYFLHDVIDSSGEYFGTPACPGDDYPCELLDAGKCKGYCIREQEKLAADFTQYFLLPKLDNLSKVKAEIEELLDGFRFSEVEASKKSEKVLTSFYHQIAFLLVTKQLNLEYDYQGKKIEIECGLIMRIDGRILDRVKQEYQTNELLAIDKSELDERWVVYNEVIHQIPEKLLECYESTREQLAEYLLNNKT